MAPMGNGGRIGRRRSDLPSKGGWSWIRPFGIKMATTENGGRIERGRSILFSKGGSQTAIVLE